ncbi:MAG: hypothetical protein K8M05_20320, partial [Deltaproteobacteria bacterium]|nr:hypothetical protein [Kofleriaceae bacterium]
MRTDPATLQLDFGPSYAPPPAPDRPDRPDRNDAGAGQKKRARKLKAVPLEVAPEGSAPASAPAPEPTPERCPSP